MEELGEFDEEFQKKQEELRKQQEAFEASQREYQKNSVAIDAAERKKMSILNWTVIGLTFLLVLFLAWRLLF